MNLNPESIARAQFFQRIKPSCVAIARLTIKSAPATGTSTDHGFKELTELIQQLLGRLEAQISIDPSVMDDKLAEYIFFPLGYALKNIETYPAALLEKVVRCLEILVVHGWKAEMAPDLAQQLLSFLAFVVDGAAAGQEKGRRDVPEETEIAAFSAIAALFNTIGTTPAGSAALASPGAAPAISHSVAATLEGVTGGKSPESQLAALRAVDAVFKNVKDHATLASFLPGTVSALAKVLSTPGHHKRRVLAMSIDTLSHVLVCALSDVKLRHIPAGAETDTGEEPGKDQVLTRSWVSATASQVKLAISAVLKLRNSNHAEIRKAQERLCISLLDECHSSLASCAQILVDTAIMLAPGEDQKGAMSVTSLVDLAAIYPELSDVAKTTVYNWMSSLPRMMQSGEEAVKARAVRNLAKGIRIMSSLQVNSVVLRDMTAPVLRDSVAALMAGSQLRKPTLLDESAPAGSSLGPPAGGFLTLSPEENHFDHVLVSGGGQASAWDGLVDLLSSVGTPAQQANLASELLELARESSGPEQASSLWISYQLVRLALGEDHEADAYLDLSALDSPSEEPESALGHLFSFAVVLVDSHAAAMSDADWRTEAIALEVITFAASRLGQAFRLELIDVLYPICTFLGSANPNLRTHAIVSLNLITRHCGYQAVSDLIVHNADYMINSVGLRLNTLDIPPESTQVLVMIVRLAGPKIVPFMDDIVASIFSALESYHGYPLFVEGLFSVLREIVEQGAKADPLVEDRGSGHRKRAPSRSTLESVAETLNKRKERDEARRGEADEIAEVDGERGHPEVPWGRESPPRVDGAEEHEAPADEPDEDNPPSPPTYQLMLKIADLTQHYLTSPAPRLRKCLLDLLDTAAPALGSREDQLLPLINTVWPVVVNRLYDPEPYVAIAACDAICALCSAAGDFLGSRLRTEWTDRLERWCRAVKDGQRSKAQRRRLGWEGGRDSTRESAKDGGDIIRIPGLESSQPRADPLASPGQDGAGAGLGRFSQAAKGWDAVVRLLTAMASYVRVDDEMFDDMLELLVDELDGRPEVRQALETLNEDAVWLARYERGHVEWRPAPALAGVSFPEMNRTVAATQPREPGLVLPGPIST